MAIVSDPFDGWETIAPGLFTPTAPDLPPVLTFTCVPTLVLQLPRVVSEEESWMNAGLLLTRRKNALMLFWCGQLPVFSSEAISDR